MSPLIAIPTYNEVDNIDLISKRVLDAVPECHLLFIDDNSPDGTGQRLRHLSKLDNRISVIHRSDKLGIGSAHLVAIEYAYKNSIDVLVTMDADLTHSPEHIPQLLELLRSAEVVIASRFMGNGGLSDWNFTRKLTTHLGHLLTRILLQIPYDSSGAFRAYRISKIPVMLFSLIQSNGYSFFFESTKILEINRTRITEMPVVLPSRTYGHSKMKTKDIFKSVSFMISLSIRSIFKSDDLMILGQKKE
jgi:dolichol-phosphate mannosyltransferase